MEHRIMELYSGIGGMHCAWNNSGLPGGVVFAIDVNTVANEVYKHNFQGTKVITRNIQSLTPKEVKKLNVNTILMSPPCQPFTRNGKYLDSEDPRTNSFLHLLRLFEDLEGIEYILMENVKGFECSSVHDLFIETLTKCDFEYQEFLLCPMSVGVPNSRLRYYCIARRTSVAWHFRRKSEIMISLPNSYPDPHSLVEILETEVDDKYLVPNKLLKRANIMDICYKNSKKSCCFTKAYSHYVEGTGSVFTTCTPQQVEDLYKSANKHQNGSEEFIESLLPLKLRFFTPKEVLSLMSFPSTYSFPQNITTKQCYRLIGNSVNVKVISELLKILFN